MIYHTTERCDLQTWSLMLMRHSSIHSDSRKKSDSGFGDVSNTLERKKGSRRKLIVNLQLKSTEPGQERNYLLTKTIIDFLSVMSRAPTAGYAVLF